MRELLPLIPKPSRYTGLEDGAIHKNPAKAALHVVLAFPDTYEVGMSYLGQKILYSIVNNNENWLAERVMAPCRETAAVLREHKKTLSTLESGTPLSRAHLLGFSVTHELCYTNILYMLDLAGIPLKAGDRGEDLFSWPIVIAGGGAALSAEPLAPFMDLMALGEGEETTADLAALLVKARSENWPKPKFLEKAGEIPGIYVPSFFRSQSDGSLVPLKDAHKPARRIVPDLNDAPYPVSQIIPIGAVHNRLAIEIARGCTRGCRFCHAGMVYRPVRERTTKNIFSLLENCLAETGFEEVSFLSLSTGDFSALKNLYETAFSRCAGEQVAISLPSLRVGSIDDSIMERMSRLRRTGATLAPEAGSERLRQVINKGITEEELILHIRKLAHYGWRQVKLYFMIGLPTETLEDLDAIADLCVKARYAAGGGKDRMQITAAISPFVPKPFTPFQWEAQLSLEAMRVRIDYLRNAFKKHKGLTMRWHDPEMSHLEGILSRGDRRLAAVVEDAWRNGAAFDSWAESFSLAPWLDALAKNGLSPDDYIRERSPEEPLPWDHLNAGIDPAFLLKERERAYALKYTADCRYNACRNCGACDTKASPSLLPRMSEKTRFGNILNFYQRDQQEQQSENKDRPAEAAAAPPRIAASLAVKAVRFRIWHNKEGLSSFLSQLELQAMLERAMRRAGLPLAFSQGFHPLPLMSFGRALPVGVESKAEWFAITLREILSAGEVKRRLKPHMPAGLGINHVIPEPLKGNLGEAVSETFLTRHLGDMPGQEKYVSAWRGFFAQSTRNFTRQTKKGERTYDLRAMVRSIKIIENNYIEFITDWNSSYISPLALCLAIAEESNPALIGLTKTKQEFEGGRVFSPTLE